LMHAPSPSPVSHLTHVCRNCSLVRDESNTSSRSRIRCYLTVAPLIPSSFGPPLFIAAGETLHTLRICTYTCTRARTLDSLVACRDGAIFLLQFALRTTARHGK
jgi:hypothetical protein